MAHLITPTNSDSLNYSDKLHLRCYIKNVITESGLPKHITPLVKKHPTKKLKQLSKK